MSGLTYFEEIAQRRLAERGATETSRPLAFDMAKWLEAMYEEGVQEGRRRIRDAVVRLGNDLERFVAEVDESRKAGKTG